MQRILVVDDEPQILRMLRTALQSSGYLVTTAADGVEALSSFERERPDLVVTDLSMPRMDGLELTRALRRVAHTPIVVLSVRETDTQKVAALDEGADDYLTKPFSMPELLARVRAHLRRAAAAGEASAPVLVAGDFTLDSANHTATLCGEPLHLTPKEFDLLRVLLEHPGRVMTHKALLRAVWGAGGESQPEYLRVLVGQVRRKLDGAGARPLRYIVSEPWIGYRLVPEGTDTAE